MDAYFKFTSATAAERTNVTLMREVSGGFAIMIVLTVGGDFKYLLQIQTRPTPFR